MAAETLKSPPLPGTLTQTGDGLVYNPAALTPEEQAARQTNEQKMANETFFLSSEPDADDSDGISFGDMTTRRAPGGLTATPTISGNLLVDGSPPYFNKFYTVSEGGGEYKGRIRRRNTDW